MIPVPEPKLDHLYQEVILDHNKSPRNYKALSDANVSSHGYNPLCGDDYHVYLKIDPKGLVHDIGFQGSGCAISKSSASIMTTLVKGKSLNETAALSDQFLRLITSEISEQPDEERLGKLAVFAGVREFPARIKCASLGWHALKAAVQGEKKPVSTEEPSGKK